MDKLKEKYKNMSLRKALLSVSAITLCIVGVLSAAAILTASDIRQKILDTRNIIVTDYRIESGLNDGFRVEPREYTYGELTAGNRISCLAATTAMILLPLLNIIIGSVAMAKLYYKLKLQVPLKELKSGMAHMADQDLDFQIGYESEDELGKLCGAFEQMRNEIYAGNRRMWDMLQERRALTASISHDLRTPVTVIKGYLDYIDRSLEKGKLTEDTLRLTVQNITQAAERLERYVDCVKDIQRIEDIEIRKDQINLEEWISGISKDFSVLAGTYGKKIKTENDLKTKQIVSDKEMLSKILENLFDNALRFADREIIFSAAETDGSIFFSVQDDGSGFAETEWKTALSFFYRSPTNGGNFGIGLSICRILCDKLDGVLHLENTPGSGAKVTVEIRK